MAQCRNDCISSSEAKEGGADLSETLVIWSVSFDVLVTVHLSIILAINQLNAQNLLL